MLKKRLALLVLLAVGSVTLLLLPATLANQKSRAGRVIKDATRGTPVAPPIRLTEVRAGGRRVNVRERFAAADNWLDDLNLTVENVSEKEIEYLEVVLLFHNASPDVLPTEYLWATGMRLGRPRRPLPRNRP